MKVKNLNAKIYGNKKDKWFLDWLNRNGFVIYYDDGFKNYMVKNDSLDDFEPTTLQLFLAITKQIGEK